MCPSLTIALNMSVIQSAAASPAAVNISDTKPEGPAALPSFALAVAARTSSTVISSAGPLTGLTSSKPSLFHLNSSFNRFSKCSFHTSFILVSLIAIFPSLSFTHPSPTTSLFFFTICFAILNKCPFMFSSSNWAPNFFLSNFWALNISLLAFLLVLQYNALSFFSPCPTPDLESISLFFNYFSNLLVPPPRLSVLRETLSSTTLFLRSLQQTIFQAFPHPLHFAYNSVLCSGFDLLYETSPHIRLLQPPDLTSANIFHFTSSVPSCQLHHAD